MENVKQKKILLDKSFGEYNRRGETVREGGGGTVLPVKLVEL